ncbi:MAG: alkaline phosphatase family protein [Asgard group archaeon]|nr:alkaline phosphatase family protein [Asgard group archaeon]
MNNIMGKVCKTIYGFYLRIEERVALLENYMVLKPFKDRNDLYYPDLNRNISKVLPTALTLLDYKFPKSKTLSQELSSLEGWQKSKEGNVKNILLITIDALGYQQFMDYSKLLKEKSQSHSLCISSVFPTITSTCISTLKYGEMPIQHGIVGHRINFAEIGNVVDTLTLRARNSVATLPQAGVKVKDWIWSDFPFCSSKSDLSYYRLNEDHIVNSGLSHIVSENLYAIGHSSSVDCFGAAQKILETNEPSKKIVDAYVGSVDHVTHRYTTKSEILKEEIRILEQVLFNMMRRLAPKVAEETVVIITADHGQENLIKENKIVISQDEEEKLASLIRNRGRSGRVIHLYSKEGKQDKVIEFFEKKVGEKGVILTPKDYPSLMGKGADEKKVVDRLGDVQVVLGKGASMFFGHSGEYDPEFNLGLNATHGSLSKNELLVPLIIGRISDIIK